MVPAQSVGARLLAARRALGLSRRAVQEASGVSARALEKLEADQQEISLSRAVALCRLYGLSLAQLADEDGARVHARSDPTDSQKAQAVHGLLGLVARILTRETSPDVHHEHGWPHEEQDQAVELPPLLPETVLQLFDQLDQVVATGQQPRQLPAIVHDLLQEGTALEPDGLRKVAIKRGIGLPDGLATESALQLLIADAFYDGITRWSTDELDDLADRVATAAGIKRGKSFFGGSEVLAERRSRLLPAIQDGPEERRKTLLRQLPPVIVSLALRRSVPAPKPARA